MLAIQGHIKIAEVQVHFCIINDLYILSVQDLRHTQFFMLDDPRHEWFVRNAFFFASFERTKRLVTEQHFVV
jgi:hypothetical protein